MCPLGATRPCIILPLLNFCLWLKTPYIENIRLSPVFTILQKFTLAVFKPHGLVFLQQFTYFAVGIISVPKNPRLCRARNNAIRILTISDPVDAEVALINPTVRANIRQFSLTSGLLAFFGLLGSLFELV